MTRNSCLLKKVWILLVVLLAVWVKQPETASAGGLTEDLTEDLVQTSGLENVKVIISPDKGVHQLDWQLEELWTLGGEDEEDVPLGYITAVVYQDNHIYILDTKDSKVYVMTREGQCIALIDVTGEGPGQCTRPNTLLGLGGNRFALVKGQPAKLIITDFYYNYPKSYNLMIPEADMYSFVIVNSIRSSPYRFLAYTETSIIVDREKPDFATIKALSSFSPQGDETRRYFSRQVGALHGRVPSEREIPHYAYRNHFAVDESGRVYVAPYRDRYLIYQFSAEGELEKIIGRDFRQRERTRDEMVLASFMGEHQGMVFEMEVEKTEADILGISLLGSQLLVRNSYSEFRQPSGIYTKLDVFEGGEFSAQVNLRGEGTAARDELYFLSPNLLAVVHGNMDAVQSGIENQLSNYRAQAVSVTLYQINR